jgi:hypothetical protein
MDDPDDLFQLVLGMTRTSLFNETFLEGSQVSKENFSDWFNAKTAEFGGQDVIKTVKDLVGNSAKFDFQSVSSQIPRVDLEDLKPFVSSMLFMNGKRANLQMDNDGQEFLSFITPEQWRNEPGLRRVYENMCFNRNYRGKEATQKILGVGHMVVDKAIEQAREFPASLMTSDKIEQPHFVFRVVDQVTDTGGTVRAGIAAVIASYNEPNKLTLLKDWNLLGTLNHLIKQGGVKKATFSSPPKDVAYVEKVAAVATTYLTNNIEQLKLSFRDPKSELMAILWPVERVEVTSKGNAL